MDNNYIYDKNIWITGASFGIGYEISKLLSQHRCNLILSSRNVENLTNAAMSFSGNAKIFAFPLDIGSSQSVNSTFEFLSHEVGFPDILINNAGIYDSKTFLDTDENDFDNIINTNFKGIFNTTKCVIPAMIEACGGTIINIGSITANKPFKNCALYSASKAGMLTMMNCIREEVREFGIKIINVIPGAVATHIWENKFLEKNRGLMTTPNDVAELVVSALLLCNSHTSMLEDIIIRPQNGDF